MARDEIKLPVRLRIFLFLASKFSSEKVRINIAGDVVEEYEADCAERGRAEANKRLNKQIVKSILPLVYTFYLAKTVKAVFPKIKNAPSNIKKALIFAQAFSLLIAGISFTLLRSTLWQRNLVTQEQRRVPESKTSNNEQALNREHIDATPDGKYNSTTPRRSESSTRISAPNQNPAVPEKRAGRPPVALASFTLTYDEVTRGEVKGEKGTRELAVKGSRTRFLLTLPRGSKEGLYRINIEDPFGNVKLTTTARSLDGRTISFMAEMKSLVEGNHRLSVSRKPAPGEVEAPFYYPFAIRK